jgi:phosphotriesterase-related protein
MPTVETATGPLDVEELGTTLVHEHLVVRDEAVHAQWPHAPTIAEEEPPHEVDADGAHEVAAGVARALGELGVRTICDPSAMFLGRDVGFMRRVSEETGLQVVPCTGIYTYDHLPLFLLSRDADQIADLFVHDIERGIQGTEIKAAFIKCAADEPGVTENIEKVHRAAARASVRTGTPIMAHSRPASETAPRQI